jgi:hypothetical protein
MGSVTTPFIFSCVRSLRRDCLGSGRCRQTALLSPASGTSTLSLSPNNIPPEIYKTLFSSRVQTLVCCLRAVLMIFTDPASTDSFPEDYMERVRTVHQDGAYGSKGYRYPWKRAETERLVLRTHTTAVSAAMLYEIANAPGGFKPAKLFSIDRVFRNEAVDATHLAEFHQVEGVVVDYNITLGDLIGKPFPCDGPARTEAHIETRLHGNLLFQDGRS